MLAEAAPSNVQHKQTPRQREEKANSGQVKADNGLYNLFSPLDEAGQHLLLQLIRSCKIKYDDTNSRDLTKLQPRQFAKIIFDNFTEARAYIFFLGTTITDLKTLSSIRQLCTWALIAMPFALERRDAYEACRVRDLQVYEELDKMLTYAALQHNCTDHNALLLLCGDEIFDRLLAFLKFYKAGSQNKSEIAYACEYLRSLARLLNVSRKPGIQDETQSANNVAVPTSTAPTQDQLVQFYRQYNAYLVPPVLCDPLTKAWSKDLLDHICTVLECDIEQLMNENIAYIVDFGLRKTTITYEAPLYLISGHSNQHYMRANGIHYCAVAVFNLTVTEEVAKKTLEHVADFHKMSYQAMFDKQFLGFLFRIQHMIVGEFYFSLRLPQIAAGINVLLDDLNASILNTYAAKLMQALASLRSELEDFSCCWLTVIGRLDPNLLVRNGYMLLFYITQLHEPGEVLKMLVSVLTNKVSPALEDEAHNIITVAQLCFGEKCIAGNYKSYSLELVTKALYESPHLSYHLMAVALAHTPRDTTLTTKIRILEHILPLTPKMSCVQEMAMLGVFIGQLGAISPSMLVTAATTPSTAAEKNCNPSLDLVLNGPRFINIYVRKLIEDYSMNNKPMTSNLLGFCLQLVSQAIRTFGQAAVGSLSSELREGLAMFSKTAYKIRPYQAPTELPLIKTTGSHEEWIVAWYCLLTPFIKTEPLKLLHCMTESYVNIYTKLYTDFLPHVLLCCLAELDANRRQTLIYDEIIAVMSNVGLRPDIKDSCRFIFSFLASVNEAAVSAYKEIGPKCTNAQKRTAEKISKAFDEIKPKLMQSRTPGATFPHSVHAAVACNDYYSALYLIEQYVVKKEINGMAKFDREMYGLIQQLYYKLNDVDNTQGAYLHIINNSTARNSETLINYDVSGDVTANLSILTNSTSNWEQMCNYLLQLNQPEVALAYVCHHFPSENLNDLRAKHPRAFSMYVTAAMELGRWEPIADAENIERAAALSEWQIKSIFGYPAVSTELTFNAHVASTLSACRVDDIARAREYYELAEVNATRALFKTTADGGQPYTTGFKHMQQLHSLADIRVAWPTLSEHIIEASKRFSEPPAITTAAAASVAPVQTCSLEELFEKWKKHDNHITKTHRDFEAILAVRRHIIRSTHLPDAEIKSGLTKLLVQSCQLVRNDNMPDLVLPFLTEAVKNGVSNIDIEEQRALYHAESADENKRLQAVPIMSSAIAKYFPRCSQFWEQRKCQPRRSDGRKEGATGLPTLRGVGTREDTNRFVEAAITLLDIGRGQRESRVTDIIRMYDGLEEMGAKTERLFYRYANFVDAAFKDQHTAQSVRLLIRLCIDTLKLGTTHSRELMPRIITAWLDTVTIAPSNIHPPIDANQGEATSLIVQAFKLLGTETLYIAFPLLVARLAKYSLKDSKIFAVLKDIMSDLIVKYPHQCVLLSIGELRSTEKEHAHRVKAMQAVYTQSMDKDKKVKVIIEAYKFITGQLMQLATLKPSGNSSSIMLNAHFGDFISYFDPKFIQTSPKRQRKSAALPKRIPIPLFFATLDAPFIIENVDAVPSDVVTIERLQPKVQVMQTLAKPKRLDLRGSDGKIYSVLCKPDDELRKDARYMDLATHTRNDGLQIRTFGVIPLQEKGGIIEWVPNQQTLGTCLKSNVDKSEQLDMYKSLLNKRDMVVSKRQQCFTKCCECQGLQMRNWLQSISKDPASYYHTQRRYTTSSAIMCAVGFIVGLGDRHIGNILIDETNGTVMHVDFALLFNAGERLPVSEKVPFRLTRNVVDGFGPLGIEGRFRFTLERCISFFRSEKAAILLCLKSFLHDPLLEWKVKEDTRLYDEKSVKCRIEHVDNRLSGYNNSLLLPKSGPYSVREQVAKQIEIAMDEENLADMFIGWSAYM